MERSKDQRRYGCSIRITQDNEAKSDFSTLAYIPCDYMPDLSCEWLGYTFNSAHNYADHGHWQTEEQLSRLNILHMSEGKKR